MFQSFTIVLLLLTTEAAAAQQYSVKVGTIGHREQQMSVSYGLGAVQNSVDPNVPAESVSTLGPLALSYLTNPTSSFAIGAELGYHELKARWQIDPSSAGMSVPYLKRSVHLAAQSVWTWYDGRWLSISSSASLGVALISHEREVSSAAIAPAYHIGLVSLRATGDVAFRLELGFGYRGLVNMGMCFVM
ncbi:MAG: hypothetical protein FGM33_09270 [Candidatus Kapabacteria bacterium]|nr:hypothetical protein [Candidatus Kapabacteria bacterium]